jgi:hypothetical protein
MTKEVNVGQGGLKSGICQNLQQYCYYEQCGYRFTHKPLTLLYELEIYVFITVCVFGPS